MNERAAAMRGTPLPPTPERRAASRGPALLAPVARRVATEDRAKMALDQQTPVTNDTEDPNDVGQREDAAANEKMSDDDAPSTPSDTKKPDDDDDKEKESEKKLTDQVTREPGLDGQPVDERDKGAPPAITDKDNTDYTDTMADDKADAKDPHTERGEPANPWDASLTDFFSGGSDDEVQKGLLTPIDPPSAQDLSDEMNRDTPEKKDEDSDDMDYLLPWNTHGDA